MTTIKIHIRPSINNTATSTSRRIGLTIDYQMMVIIIMMTMISSIENVQYFVTGQLTKTPSLWGGIPKKKTSTTSSPMPNSKSSGTSPTTTKTQQAKSQKSITTTSPPPGFFKIKSSIETKVTAHVTKIKESLDTCIDTVTKDCSSILNHISGAASSKAKAIETKTTTQSYFETPKKVLTDLENYIEKLLDPLLPPIRPVAKELNKYQLQAQVFQKKITDAINKIIQFAGGDATLVNNLISLLLLHFIIVTAQPSSLLKHQQQQPFVLDEEIEEDGNLNATTTTTTTNPLSGPSNPLLLYQRQLNEPSYWKDISTVLQSAVLQFLQLGILVTSLEILQKMVNVHKSYLFKQIPIQTRSWIPYISNTPIHQIGILLYQLVAVSQILRLKDSLLQSWRSSRIGQAGFDVKNLLQQNSSYQQRFVQSLSQLSNYFIYGAGVLYAIKWITSHTNSITALTTLVGTLSKLFNRYPQYQPWIIGGISLLLVLILTSLPFDDLLSGFILTLTGQILPYDYVTLPTNSNGKSSSSTGTSVTGTVTEMGLLRSMVQNRADNSIVSIPHSLVAKQVISNLSHAKGSTTDNSGNIPNHQVIIQSLYFPIEDTEKMSGVCESILHEIRMVCPELHDDSDNNRPFLAHWVDINTEYLTVFVEAHFDIPTSNYVACIENKERVLRAVNYAVKKHQLDYYEK